MELASTPNSNVNEYHQFALINLDHFVLERHILPKSDFLFKLMPFLLRAIFNYRKKFQTSKKNPYSKMCRNRISETVKYFYYEILFDSMPL